MKIKYVQRFGEKIDPDTICDKCRKKIEGGFMHFDPDTDYCTNCFNELGHHFDHTLRREVLNDNTQIGLFAPVKPYNNDTSE